MGKGYAIVTGSSRGIGKGCAEQLAKEGYGVLINYKVSKDLAEAHAKDLAERYGVKTAAFMADVSDIAQMEAMRDFAVKIFGEDLRVLVNNAGVGYVKSFFDLTNEELSEMINVDLVGTIYGYKLFAPIMMKNKFGRIVSMASTSGLRSTPNTAAYCAAKGGQIAFNRGMAIDLGPYNITCNCICPGFIRTETSMKHGEEFFQRIANLSPLKVVADVEDVQRALSYLINSDVMTGQSIAVNCGTHSW
jgi:NAD(P)-dependent dehydrogenase (short-subunit alcohol dehydrogenase family)